jgi:hypothetical protein
VTDARVTLFGGLEDRFTALHFDLERAGRLETVGI